MIENDNESTDSTSTLKWLEEYLYFIYYYIQNYNIYSIQVTNVCRTN